MGDRKMRPIKTIALAAILLLLLIIKSNIFAATITSAADGAWNSTSTWVGGIIPFPTDDVVISHNVTIPQYYNASCNNVTIQTGSSLTVYDKFVINGNLNILGTLSTAGSLVFDIELWKNVTISGTLNDNAASATFYFGGTTAQTLTYNNSSSDLELYYVIIDNGAGVTFSGSGPSNINVAELILQTGTLSNGTILNLGLNGSTDAILRIGGDLSSTAGTLNSAVLLNSSVTDYSVYYDYSNSSYNIGNEIPVSGNVKNLTVMNSYGVYMTKNITVSGLLTLIENFYIQNYILTVSGSPIIGNAKLKTNSSSEIVISSSSTGHNIPGGIELKNLTINNSSGVSQYPRGTLTIHGSLNLISGVYSVTGRNNVIVFSNTASNPIETESSHIFGTANMLSRSVDTNAISFLGFDMTAGSDNVGNVTISRTTGTQTFVGGSSSCAVNWAVTMDKPLTSNRDMILQWLPTFDGGKIFSTTNIGQMWINNLSWVSIDGNFTLLNANGFREIAATSSSVGSQIVSSSTDAPLPVELISFSSNVIGRDVLLNWETASEVNNFGFDIERQNLDENNRTWEKIGFVQGKGNSSSVEKYSFRDSKLETGNYSYRIKQTDFNGNFEYFELNNYVIIAVPSKFNLSQNYPNPFNPSTKIDFEIPAEVKVLIKVYDITGKEIKTLLNESRQAGYHSINFDASGLASGVYFYNIKAGEFNRTLKMILNK